MKKTLITLAALAMASVASAADVTSSTGFFAGEDSTTMSNLSVGTYAESYEFTFTLECSLSADTLVAAYWHGSHTDNGAHAFVIDSETMTLKVGLGSFGSTIGSINNREDLNTWTWTSYADDASAYSRVGTFDTTLTVGTTYTVSLTSNTAKKQTATLSWIDADNVAQTATAQYDGRMNGDASWAGSGVVTKVVPEPTTATLSLLALAGLAARRRRK